MIFPPPKVFSGASMALAETIFANFQKVNIAENETNYTISDSDLFNTDSDLFFSNDPIIKIDPSDNDFSSSESIFGSVNGVGRNDFRIRFKLRRINSRG